MLEFSPGQETTSLLLSPEGQLISLMQIEEAEQRALDEAPWCFVKTQFGSVEGHTAIVELLTMLKRIYFQNLEVSDESGYWEHRDSVRLKDQMTFLGSAIRNLGQAIEQYGLSPEAAEDPEILATRIERVAALVHRKMQRPPDVVDPKATKPLAENAPGDGATFEEANPSFEETVAQQEKEYRRNQLRSERMSRSIDEALAKGATHEDAFRVAMEAEGLSVPTSTDESESPVSWEGDDESWRGEEAESDWNPRDETAPEATPDVVRDAEALLLEVMQRASESHPASSFFSIAQQGLMDVVGGLVQATSFPDEHDDIHRSLNVVQLKRSLKGAAFARGAVFGLRSAELIDSPTSRRWHTQLERIVEQIQELLADAWSGAGDAG